MGPLFPFLSEPFNPSIRNCHGMPRPDTSMPGLKGYKWAVKLGLLEDDSRAPNLFWLLVTGVENMYSLYSFFGE